MANSPALFFTAGITLSNGAKTFLAALFTNGKKLFRPKYLALGIILPTLLIGAAGIYQNKAFIIPNRLEGERLVAQKAAKDSTFRAKMEQKQNTIRPSLAKYPETGHAFMGRYVYLPFRIIG